MLQFLFLQNSSRGKICSRGSYTHYSDDVAPVPWKSQINESTAMGPISNQVLYEEHISYCESEPVDALLLALPWQYQRHCASRKIPMLSCCLHQADEIINMYIIFLNESIHQGIRVDLFVGTILMNWPSCEALLASNFGTDFQSKIKIHKIEINRYKLFISRLHFSAWIRDFGPLFYRDEMGNLGSVDSKYFPTYRPADDKIPQGIHITPFFSLF